MSVIFFAGNQVAHFLPNTPLSFHADWSTFANAFNFGLEALKSRIKCRCPNIDERQFVRNFVPSIETLLFYMSPENADVNICNYNLFSQTFAKQKSLNPPISFNAPSSCTLASVTAGQPCFAEIELTPLDMTLQVAIENTCPSKMSGTTNYLPFISITCKGNGCANLGKPCTSSSECGALQCSDPNLDLTSPSVLSSLQQFGMFPAASCPGNGVSESWTKLAKDIVGFFQGTPSASYSPMKFCLPAGGINETNLGLTISKTSDTVYCNGKTGSAACSGKGQCTASGCQCDSGFEGFECQAQSVCFNKTGNAACNGKGTCRFGYCTCNTGYFGSECTSTSVCNGINSTNPAVCSGHGTCSSGFCSCASGFNGFLCNTFSTCNGTLGNSTNVCSGRGKCLFSDYCQCNSSYYGSSCQFEYLCNGKSPSDPSACPNGYCSYTSCICNPGRWGSSCSMFSPGTYATTVSLGSMRAWTGALTDGSQANSAARKAGQNYPSINLGVTAQRTPHVTVLRHFCNGSMYMFPESKMGYRSTFNEIPSLGAKIDKYLYESRSCNSISLEAHRNIMQLWQLNPWLIMLTKPGFNPLEYGTNFVSKMNIQTLIGTKSVTLPASCSYSKYNTDGTCAVTWTGLSTLVDSSVKLHLRVKRCPGALSESLPSIELYCEGQACSNVLNPAFCESNADCTGNTKCLDVGNYMLTPGAIDPVSNIFNAGDSCIAPMSTFVGDLRRFLRQNMGMVNDNKQSLKFCLADPNAVSNIASSWANNLGVTTGDSVIINNLGDYTGPSDVVPGSSKNAAPATTFVPFFLLLLCCMLFLW